MSIYIIPTITLLIFVVVWLYISYFKKPKSLKHLPSPSLLECIKATFENRPVENSPESLTTKDNKAKLQAVWKNGSWIVEVSSPKAAKMIFSDTDTFVKVIPEKEQSTLFSKFMGNNILLSNHEVWKRHRKVLNPPFKKQIDINAFSSCVQRLFNVVDTELKGENIDIFKYIQRVTLDVAGKSLLDVDINSVSNDEVPFINSFNNIVKESHNPFYLMMNVLDTPNNPLRKSVYDDLKALETFFRTVLESKKENLKDTTKDKVNEDIFTLLLRAKQDDQINYTDKEVRDTCMVVLFAGHVTTTFALSAALHFLAQNPDIQQKVREEVMNIMKIKQFDDNKNEICCPSIEQIKQMDYLTAVIKETLRLQPSFASLPLRKTTSEVEIEGYKIPKGANISLSIYNMHHDEDYWLEAETFIPERFIKDSPYYSDNSAWSPFGDGNRTCMGIGFALLEQKIIISMILLRYQVSYSKDATQYNAHGFSLGVDPLSLPTNFRLDFQML